MKTIVFTGGGTGGHIYPGLAIAESFTQKYDCKVIWLGNKEGMDKSIVEQAGLEFFGISSGKFRRAINFKNLTDIFKIIRGYFEAKKLLKKIKPDLVFSKGGYVSVPPVRAASAMKIPVFTHESDVTPGLATRLNAPLAEKIYVPYQETKDCFKEELQSRITVSGNPVRSAFFTKEGQKGFDFLNFPKEKKLICVLGGSQGAKQINDLIDSVYKELGDIASIVHQRGKGNLNPSIPKDDAAYRQFEYINDELPSVLKASTLVISRAGAGTLWECASAGKPMLLIPLKGIGTRGDQVLNAELFAKHGSARVLNTSEENKESFLNIIKELLLNDELLLQMSSESYRMSSGNASEKIADDIATRIQAKVKGN